MLAKIDISKIVKDHMATLRDDATGKPMLSDFVLFFGLPAIPAVVLPRFFLLDTSAIAVLVTSLSVFAALLFNLLLLIYDVLTKAEARPKKEKRRSRGEFIRQLFSNVSFSILVAISCVVFLLLGQFLENAHLIRAVLNGVTFYLILVFLLTLIMVLKRIHALLSNEF
jgi:hypothetical protein